MVHYKHAVRALLMSQKLPHTDLKPYFQTLDDLDGVIDWQRLFGNANPVELDIGCGRGLFLFNAGLQNPDINYLGIEIDYREGRRAAKRFQKRRLANVRVLGGDVRVALSKFVVPDSVSAAHVYFPDPWWKKRHHKRRIFTNQFVEQILAILQPNGLLHSWTDVSDYFDVIESLMNHHPCFISLPPPTKHQPEHDMDFQTSFERKKRQAGLPIFRGLWQKNQPTCNIHALASVATKKCDGY